MSTYTLTFGDVSENHVGMQKISLTDEKCKSISYSKLKKIHKKLSKSYLCTLIKVHHIQKKKNQDSEIPPDFPKTGFLIFHNALQNLFSEDFQKDLTTEMKNLDWDKKAKMRGRVVNKKARYNLCFSNFDQEPDYENSKGRVYNFENLENLYTLKSKISKIIGYENLTCEGNFYYDVKKCYIGFHGDSERKIVCGVRLGKNFPFHISWFYKNKRVSKIFSLNLLDGDMYIMSDNMVGTNWKKSSIPTVRHAAGNLLYLKK